MRELIRWSGLALMLILTGAYIVNRALSERETGRGSRVIALAAAVLALAWFWFVWPDLWDVVRYWK